MYLTGDLHGEIDIHKLSFKHWPQGRTLTKEDFLIVLGDFGLAFYNPPTKTERYYSTWLNNKPWTTLFLDGNHENFDILDKLPTKELLGGKVGVFQDSIFHLRRGEIYTIVGKKIFVFGGAYSIDREFRILNKSWWEREQPSMEEYDYAWNNLEKHNWEVDYVFTHTAPTYGLYALHKGDVIFDPVSLFLEDVRRKLKYQGWYCGHLHTNEYIDSIKLQILYEDILEIPTRRYSRGEQALLALGL